MVFDEPKEVPEGPGKQEMQDGWLIIWIWHDLDLESIVYYSYLLSKRWCPNHLSFKTMKSFNM